MLEPIYPQTDSRLNQKPNTKEKIKVFLILCGTSYSFHIFGNFYFSEAILLLILLHNLLKHQPFGNVSIVRKFNRVLLLALIGELTADLIRGSDFTNGLKGFSLILFTFINLNSLALLTRMNKTLILYSLLGYAFSGLISFIIQPSTYARTEVWKFGIGPSVALAIFTIMSITDFHARKIITSILIISLSLISLFLGARSLALTIFIPVYFLQRNTKKNIAGKNQSLFKFVLVLLISTFIFSSAYSKLAENGYLGQKAEQKYLMQTSGGGNLLLNSRSELLFASRAILESPVIGYGSYGIMSPELKILILNFLAKLGINYDMEPLIRSYGDRIPIHSMVLQWWLWFGILGLAFPLKFLHRMVLTLRNKHLLPVYYFIPISCIWSTLFSPYGETSRVVVPLSILLCSDFRSDLEKEKI